MSDQSSDTTRNAFTVSLIAGIAGAAVALLFAPRSGKETRKMLNEQKESLKQQAKSNADQAKETFQKKAQEASDMKDRVVSAVKSTGEQAREEMNQIQDEVSNTNQDDNYQQRSSSVFSRWDREA